MSTLPRFGVSQAVVWGPGSETVNSRGVHAAEDV